MHLTSIDFVNVILPVTLSRILTLKRARQIFALFSFRTASFLWIGFSCFLNLHTMLILTDPIKDNRVVEILFGRRSILRLIILYQSEYLVQIVQNCHFHCLFALQK